MRRLLVVANNSLIVEAMAIGLQRSGEFRMLGSVEARADSAEILAGIAPDVVLIDDVERAPETLVLTREIKQRRPGVSVIVLTLDMDQSWLDELFDAGASGALSKEAPPEALTTLLRETLGGQVLYLRGRRRAGRLAGPPPARTAVAEAALTTREHEILELLAEGLTNGEIAQRLWVTVQTVKFHLANVYRKLGVENRTEASNVAHLRGLLSGVSDG